jgi:TRAP-type transport system small permease protein
MKIGYAQMDKGLNALLVVCLSLMGIFVFANVFLRYAFNSGLPWAEELSRFLLVWLVFLGAIGALRKNNHLGFILLVQKLPPTYKKIVYIIANCFVIGVLYIFFDGSLKMTMMTTRTLSPATGLPLSYMYSVGIVSSLFMFLIVCNNLYKVIFVKGSTDKLIAAKGSEEEISLGNQTEGEKTP